MQFWGYSDYDDAMDKVSISNIQRSYRKLMAIWVFNAFFAGVLIGYIFYWLTWR